MLPACFICIPLPSRCDTVMKSSTNKVQRFLVHVNNEDSSFENMLPQLQMTICLYSNRERMSEQKRSTPLSGFQEMIIINVAEVLGHEKIRKTV